jgi:hypothetical protein
MATDRQIQANRANAKRSTGPVTRKGKRASSRNALRHGFLSTRVVLKAESTPRFTKFLDSLIEEFHPATTNEHALVETMAVARWKLVRNWGLHTSLLETEIAKEDPEAADDLKAALAFSRLADCRQSLHLLQRYDTSLDRQYTRALSTLLKAKAARATKPEELGSFGKNEETLLPPEETSLKSTSPSGS